MGMSWEWAQTHTQSIGHNELSNNPKHLSVIPYNDIIACNLNSY